MDKVSIHSLKRKQRFQKGAINNSKTDLNIQIKKFPKYGPEHIDALWHVCLKLVENVLSLTKKEKFG